MSSGRFALGYYCNARLVSHLGSNGGFRVESYRDHSGHVCGYFDSGTMFPDTIHPEGSGVWVVDMADPAHPRLATSLTTPAMLSPHESLRVNERRGLLVADLGNGVTNAGFVDVYSIEDNCLAPKLESSTPLGVLGHEGGFAPDGNTFYVTSIAGTISAVDLRDPAHPTLLWVSRAYQPHGVSVSNDGKTLFMAAQDALYGVRILDVSQIQERMPNPVVTTLAELTWPEVSIPQNATPFTSRGHQYLIETDEFGGGSRPVIGTMPVGAARIINIDNLRRTYVVSHLRLAVHNLRDSSKTAHYCSLPSRVDPYIIACGFLSSGLRVFDVRDVAHPREVAYTNLTNIQSPTATTGGGMTGVQYGSVYSAPAYDPAHNDIWYSDASRGFFAIHLTASSGVTRFARIYRTPGS
ncbi:MAG: hypothetical protein M3N21_05215 [Actinomycetota bacterium]|nr:hypothetical protein [Actinomycetota bacterium]